MTSDEERLLSGEVTGLRRFGKFPSLGAIYYNDLQSISSIINQFPLRVSQVLSGQKPWLTLKLTPTRRTHSFDRWMAWKDTM